jgi:serine/threonine-protein kinase RsbT
MPQLPDHETLRITISESWDNQHALLKARDFAGRAGFTVAESTTIATAVSELSTNILRYAGKGELVLRVVRDRGQTGIDVLAVDEGAGIEDIEKALQDNYTTTPGSLGLGLPSVRRMMDDFEIESGPGKGTRVKVRKWRNSGKS